MTTSIKPMSTRTAAITAGVSYVLLFTLGLFSNFVVRTGLTVPGDASATLANIVESETLFRVGLLGFLVIFVLDVVVAWTLYILFRPVAEQWSLVAAWFRLVYTVFLGVAIVFMFIVLDLIGGGDHVASLSQGEAAGQVTLLLNAFNVTWLIGLLVFGVHLAVIGWIMLATRVAPRTVGVLLIVAGMAYAVDTVAVTLLSDYASYEDVFLALVAVPAVVAEFAFAVWLLWKAGRPVSEGVGV